jgi:hypothetical protein
MQAAGLPGIMNITEYFVAQDDGNGQFECLHGPDECAGDIIEICAYYLNASNEQGWWTMGLCMQTDYENIPDNAQACAKKANVNWDKIYSCSQSSLGASLFSQSIAVGNNMNVDATPTIFVDGTEYVGGPDNPLQTVCDAYTGPPPAGCKQKKAQ